MSMSYVKVFYEWYDMTVNLTDEEYGSLVRSLQRYAMDEELPTLKGNASVIFPMFKFFVDKEREAYEKKVKQCREAGSKGGKSKRTLTDENEISEEKEQEKEQEKEKENEYEKEKEQENIREADAWADDFQAPELDDIFDYCFNEGISIDYTGFYDYYTSVGWTIGGKPMRDWRAVVRIWGRRKKEEEKRRSSAGKSGSFDDDDFFKAAVEKSYADMDIDIDESDELPF